MNDKPPEDDHQNKPDPAKEIDRNVDPLAKDNSTKPISQTRGRSFSLRDLRTFTSLKNPVFRLYYFGMLGQMGAMNMQMIARSLLIYRITESGTALGIMALANAAPMLFFSLFGGVIADRVQKKYVLVAGQLVSAIISFCVGLTLVFGLMGPDMPNSWWILIWASLAQGIVMGLMMPSRQAMIAEIVPEEQLMNAVALNTFGMNFNRLLMPALGGFLIEYSGFASTYFLMTALYLVAVIFIALMPKTGTISLSGAGALADVIAGITYVKNNRTILIILIVTSLQFCFLCHI